MPKNLTPQNQWETDFQVPTPGEPRNIGPLELLFQRLLNRTERLKNRIAEILGLPWDATPPDTLSGLHSRLQAIEGGQGSTTLSSHRTAPVLDHPDGSVTSAKLADNAAVRVLGDIPLYGVDWNTLNTAGVYRVFPGGTGGNNPPPVIYPFGTLLVVRGALGGTVQIYYPHFTDEDPYVYYRASWNQPPDWTPWRKIPHTDAIVPSIPDGGIPTSKLADGAVTSSKLASGVIPYDLAVYVPGSIAGGSTFLRLLSSRPFTLAPSGHRLSCYAAPSANWSAILKLNGTVIGSLSIPAGQTTGTVSLSSQTVVAAGSLLEAVAQSGTDISLQGLTLTLVGVV